MPAQINTNLAIVGALKKNFLRDIIVDNDESDGTDNLIIKWSSSHTEKINYYVVVDMMNKLVCVNK